MSDFDIWVPLIIVISGMFGGMGNCVLYKGGFVLPRWETIKGGSTRLTLGFLDPIFLGTMASIIAYGLGLIKGDSYGQLVAYSLLAGVLGGNLITSILQRSMVASLENKVTLEDNKTNSMLNYTEKLKEILNELNKPEYEDKKPEQEDK